MNRSPFVALALALPCAATNPLAAQAPAPLSIPRLSGPISLDGRPDEAAWDAVRPLPLTTYLPVAGRQPTDSSEVRLAYDDRYLYASGRFFVSDSSEIQSTSLGRDVLGPDDRFRLMFDTFDDNRTGVGFLVTPSGAKSDYDMTDDGRTLSSSWNTFWDAAETRDAHGWYCELRIPWSSLRFRVEGDSVVMGVIALRVSARKNEWSTWPALSSSMAFALWRASVAGKVVFHGLSRRSPVYATPYALGGLGRNAQYHSAAPGFDYVGTRKTELGADVKYGLADDLTLDLTVNTDFAQVEADNQQVNLSRFSLFFPEKRQFFLERSGSFDFLTTSQGRLFYSRRIGLADDGTPLRIYAGSRLVGRAGSFDLGAMDLQVARPEGGTENIGVVRVQHRVLDDKSYVGGLLTSRLSAGHHNILYAADAVLHPFGNEYLTAQVARTVDDSAGSGLPASEARLNWARRSSKGLIYFGDVRWLGRAFMPRLGFEPHTDVTEGQLELDYNFLSRTGLSIQPSFYGYFYRRNGDGKLDLGELYPYLNFILPSGLNGWVAWRAWQQDLPSPLPLAAGVAVPAGTHRYQQGEIHIVSPTGSRLGYTILGDVGSFYDGQQAFLDIVPTWSVSPHLTIGGEYQLNRISFPPRGQTLNADLARLKVAVAWNSKLTGQAFLQYNNSGHLGVGNVRLRYQFAEGHDLYVVYNEQVNTARDRLLPMRGELPWSQARTLLVKYTRTFIR